MVPVTLRRQGACLGEHAVPVLPSRDLRETLGFYERLGFENRGAPPEEWDHLIIGRGGVELHVYAAPDVDSLTTSFMCYVYVHQFAVVDRSGDLLRSGSRGSTADRRGTSRVGGRTTPRVGPTAPRPPR